MKKTLLKLTMMVAFMAAMAVGRTQNNVPITLVPGWNWISYPNAEAMDIATALGDFTPMQGDVIKAQGTTASYRNGVWRGRLSQFLPGMGYKYYSMRTENVELVFAQASSSFVTTAEPTDITGTSAVVGGTVTLGEGNHVFARGVCWSMEPNPDVDDSHSIDATVTGFLSVTLTGLTPETTYYVRAYAVTDYGLAYGEELSFTTDIAVGNDHTYVDLGLPSGLLWATCNVGADTPEAYGDYFAWGETQPKDYYHWSTYQHCMGSDKVTKYCTHPINGYNGFTDDLTTLLPEDDAATANWGSDWRMPTTEEFEELCNNTTVTWTQQNGVNGRLFTASNGNSLFLPAAGYYNGSNGKDVGSYGHYWSSSLSTDYSYYARKLYFYSSHCYYNAQDYRRYGLTVRPVRSAPQSNAPTGAIDGKFSINEDGGQVYFSQGNLQYQASSNTWKFAENQYDYVGEDNENISSTYDGWIDLFGWGTSGWDSGNTYYQPWSSADYDESNGGQLYGPPGEYALIGDYANADWGVYNPISNGGNTANQWRTLTQPEWNYVFNTRATTSGIRYAKANVDNVNGVILLPDDWNSSTYSLSNTNTDDASFSSNTISVSQWTTLENAGAVFLPAAGGRNGTSVGSVGSYGSYWSASYNGSSRACIVDFYGSSLSSSSSSYRYDGRAVRLVRVAE